MIIFRIPTGKTSCIFSRVRYDVVIMAVNPAVLRDNTSRISEALLFRAPVNFLLT